MTFFQTQLDKLTTALFNRWIISAVVLVVGLGFSTDQLMMLAVKTIQECGFK